MDNKYISALLALHGFMFSVLAFLDIVPALNADLSTYEPVAGWTGFSWLLSGLIPDSTVVILALIGYIVSTALFVISAVIFMTDSHLWRVSILTACIFSSLVLILFWDGSFDNIGPKGIVGLILNIIIAIFVNHK